MHQKRKEALIHNRGIWTYKKRDCFVRSQSDRSRQPRGRNSSSNREHIHFFRLPDKFLLWKSLWNSHFEWGQQFPVSIIYISFSSVYSFFISGQTIIKHTIPGRYFSNRFLPAGWFPYRRFHPIPIHSRQMRMALFNTSVFWCFISPIMIRKTDNRITNPKIPFFITLLFLFFTVFIYFSPFTRSK